MASKRKESKRRVYSTAQKSNESTLQWYRRLAKTADQRLVRLEQAPENKRYNEALRGELKKATEGFAFQRALYDIEAWSGTGANRFNTKPPKNEEQLLQKINDIRSFLESGTSTPAQIKNLISRTNTINKKYGSNFTWDEIARFYEKKRNDKVDAFAEGSDTLMRALAQLHNKWKKEDIEEGADINKVVSQDEVVDEVANRILENGYTYEDLFG